MTLFTMITHIRYYIFYESNNKSLGRIENKGVQHSAKIKRKSYYKISVLCNVLVKIFFINIKTPESFAYTQDNIRKISLIIQIFNKLSFIDEKLI